MNKLIAFVCKFWLVFVPFIIVTWMFFLIPYSINFISTTLSVIVGFSLFFFWCALVSFTVVNFDYILRDLFQMSVKKNWNKNIQTFLKFLWEN